MGHITETGLAYIMYIQQLRIEARDLAMNRKTDEKKLRYKINRNRNAPVFQPTIYSETILETKRPGEQIVKVTATDNDEQVLHVVEILI